VAQRRRRLQHGAELARRQHRLLHRPDSWHEYSPNGYSAVLKPYSYSVSPGFNRYDSQGPFLARDPGQFDKAVAAMAAAPVQWKLVTTFNEWGEGTAVEPAAEWGNTYLDILHNHLGSR
jgi:hypothetical protein